VNEKDIIDLLRLYSIPGIGSARFRNLLNVFGTPQNVLSAPLQRLTDVNGIERSTALKIKNGVSDANINKQLRFLKDKHIKIIAIWDPAYPPILKKIYDPPSVLFVSGEFNKKDEQAIAVVGTREPTFYGRYATEMITRELIRNNFTIVSGLARGADTIAHQTALKNGGRTIAVLGSGMDILYPPENTRLAIAIAGSGAVISEYPLGTIPDPGNFPRRNRIVSGLSLGVLVTEAGNKSGAIITAFEALEQNREVFAVPGPINSRQSLGTNRLIKAGAKLVQEPDDILQELDAKINIKKTAHENLPELDDKEKEIYNFLTENPIHIDQLARKCQRSTSEVISVLLTLELIGIVKQLSGKMFMRI
jgi:DNA processing protein